ncbi:MAG: plastocyanin/azurin family copper-binding protein [Myxococcaceae bacterium]
MKFAVVALVLTTALVVGAAPPKKKAASHEVTMGAMKFTPATVNVHPGETITWTNKDIVPHTVLAPPDIMSPLIQPGETFSWKAEKPGTKNYMCSLHAMMKGTIIVK